METEQNREIRLKQRPHGLATTEDFELVITVIPRPDEGQALVRNASFKWQEWQFRRAFLLVPAQGIVGKFVKSFEEFPPRGKPASFSVGDALKKLSTPQHN